MFAFVKDKFLTTKFHRNEWELRNENNNVLKYLNIFNENVKKTGKMQYKTDYTRVHLKIRMLLAYGNLKTISYLIQRIPVWK